MKRLIWQPDFYSLNEFSIYLDGKFARELIKTKIPPDRQSSMNNRANMDLKEMGSHWKNPYTFHEDSCFVRQIHIGEGVWLCPNYQYANELLGECPKEFIKYNSHNADNSRNMFILLSLFDTWVKYTDLLKKP